MRLCHPGTSFGQGRRSRLVAPRTASRLGYCQPFSDPCRPVFRVGPVRASRSQLLRDAALAAPN